MNNEVYKKLLNSFEKNASLLQILNDKLVRQEVQLEHLRDNYTKICGDINSLFSNLRATGQGFICKEDFKKLEDKVLLIEKKIWLWAGGIGTIAFLFTYILKGVVVNGF